MKYLLSQLFITFIAIFLGACSSSDESTKKGNSNGDVYIFDEIPSEDVYEKNDPNNKLKYYYLVQIGAFASKNNADNFAKLSTQILGEELEVAFSTEAKLYVVRFKKIFNNRMDAEKIRNELWQNDNFRDAWIIEKRQ